MPSHSFWDHRKTTKRTTHLSCWRQLLPSWTRTCSLSTSRASSSFSIWATRHWKNLVMCTQNTQWIEIGIVLAWLYDSIQETYQQTTSRNFRQANQHCRWLLLSHSHQISGYSSNTTTNCRLFRSFSRQSNCLHPYQSKMPTITKSWFHYLKSSNYQCHFPQLFLPPL